MISKQHFELGFSLATAQAIQAWADANLMTSDFTPADPVPTGTSYYFADDGSDSNDGSLASPFKTLDKMKALIPTLSLGDAVLFAMGDTFKYVSDNMNTAISAPSGTATDPIVIGRYWKSSDPTTTVLPLITGVTTSSISFTDQGGNIWKGSNPAYNSEGGVRILKDGVEQINVDDYAQFIANSEAEICTDGAGSIYHRSVANPSSSTWTYSNRLYLFNFTNTDYWIFNGIETQWTQKWSHDLNMLSSKNITVQNCKMGGYSAGAIQLSGSSAYPNNDSIIMHNILDSKWTRDFSFAYVKSSTGVGLHNMIDVVQYSNRCTIQNNTILNFGHTAISWYSASLTEVRVNDLKILDNSFSAPLSSAYARLLDNYGGQADGVEIARNTFDSFSAQSQLCGFDYNIHHNIFSNQTTSNKQTDYMPYLISGCITQSGNCDGWTIENNVFYNLTQQGIQLADVGGTNPVNIQNNIFMDCSTSAKEANGTSLRGMGIMLYPWSPTTASNFTITMNNNQFYDSLSSTCQNAIVYGDFDTGLYDKYTVAEANAEVKYSTTCNNNQDGNPLFVDTTDFRLDTGSPCVDNGIVPLSTIDFDELTISTPYNIGIYNTET